MTIEPQRVDGRTARSERTRNAIVDALVTLLAEGDLRPTAERIAKAAGVSLRALWSHFVDLEALFAAGAERVLEQLDAAYQPIPADLPLADRIPAYCHQRARLSEMIAPAARAAALKEPFSPALQHNRRLHIARVRDEVRTLFAAEIGDDTDLLNAITAVGMWNTWDTMRTPMGLTPDEARAALERTITALLRAD